MEYLAAAGLIILAYLIGIKLRPKWQARSAIATVIFIPFLILTTPLWRTFFRPASGESMGMASGFLFLSLIHYSIFVALVLTAYVFGKANRIDMIS